MLLLILLFACDDPYRPIERRHVTRLERNTFYSSETGLPQLQQWIAWGPHRETGRVQVMEWWLYKGERVVRRQDGRWVVVAWKGDVAVVIVAESYKPSHTLYDPELVDREFLGKDRREMLWR